MSEQIQIVVQREDQFFVGNPAIEIFLDGRKFGDLMRGQTATIVTEVGEHGFYFRFPGRALELSADFSQNATIILQIDRVSGGIVATLKGAVETFPHYLQGAAQTQNTTVSASIPMSADSVVQKIKNGEIISSIAWLVIGVIQCLSVAAIAAGIWNIVNAIIRLINLKNIYLRNAGVVAYFDQRKIWIIVMAIVNIVLGGVVGALLALYDWYIRDLALKNRAVFEG